MSRKRTYEYDENEVQQLMEERNIAADIARRIIYQREYYKKWYEEHQDERKQYYKRWRMTK